MNNNFVIIIFLFLFTVILLFCVGLGHATHSEIIKKLRRNNKEKSDSIAYVYQMTDSLKKQIKALEQFQKEVYSEQCRVDSIQDSYLQRLNIRTAPLLSGAQ